MPIFTVVIPLYNKENYISETLHSVLNQSFQDFEVIVVNDCSTDKSLDIVKSFSDSRIHIVEHEKNKGLSASRNTGIKRANAEYIAFLDADDLWKPQFLESIKLLIDNYPEASLFTTKYEIQLSNGKTIEFDFKFENFKKHGIVLNYFKSNLNQSTFYPSCLCVKKEVFDAIGYYNESVNYSEDIDFNIRALAHFNLAYYNTAMVVYLRVSENQITQTGLKGKTIPDYDLYETIFNDRQDIKKYLDFHRYAKAKQYKIDGDIEKFKKLKNAIDKKNINFKQQILLNLPAFMLKTIGFIKLKLQKAGIEINSYSN